MNTLTSYPKEKIKILFLEGVHPSAIQLFREHGYSGIEALSTSLSEKDIIEKIENVHLLGIRSKTQLTKKILEKAAKLIATGCFCIGTNQVNMEAAIETGVAVFNSPYSNTRSVAELVIANCIMLMRKVFEKNTAAHQGEWLKESKGCFEVRGKTLGIIGYGHIGSQVSVLAESIGLKVIFYDIEPKLSLGNAQQVKNLDDLLKKSDIVTLHVPGLSSTKNLMNAARFSKMKSGSVFINLSRGDIVDLNALKKSLEAKHITGAAIDVFPDEPKGNSDKFISELQGMSNVVLTPHIGGSTMEAQENIGLDVATKLLNFLETGTSVGSLSVPALNLSVQHNAHRLLHIHKNVPGVLSEINAVLSKNNVNILGQYLKTNEKIGYVVLDIDKKTSDKVLNDLKEVDETIKVRQLY